MEKIFGFIGAGNMGGALARAARRKLPGERLLISNRTPEKAEKLAAELDARAVGNAVIAETADYIILAVKPQMMEAVLSEIRPALTFRSTPFVLVSMAAGLSVERLRKLAEGDWPVLRIVPNTPCAIGEGVILYAAGPEVSAEDQELFLDAMSGAGRFVPLAEELFSAGSAVSGCGPAFADLFLEALADGGVACGLPRNVAMELAAQMLIGSARLMLETGKHPGALKDAVCSPGGTTIQGVRALERAGFRYGVIEAVISAWERDKALLG